MREARTISFLMVMTFKIAYAADRQLRDNYNNQVNVNKDEKLTKRLFLCKPSDRRGKQFIIYKMLVFERIFCSSPVITFCKLEGLFIITLLKEPRTAKGEYYLHVLYSQMTNKNYETVLVNLKN